MNDLSWNNIKLQVYKRARGCCEYCQTAEANIGQTMQVDHIDPNGDDNLENLCLACWNCNTSKHKAVKASDPITNEFVTLYNPRSQNWDDHFRWIDNGIRLQGLTNVGRATIERLKMNRPAIVIARQRWVSGGFHPLT
jgi:hypothetical protein